MPSYFRPAVAGIGAVAAHATWAPVSHRAATSAAYADLAPSPPSLPKSSDDSRSARKMIKAASVLKNSEGLILLTNCLMRIGVVCCRCSLRATIGPPLEEATAKKGSGAEYRPTRWPRRCGRSLRFAQGCAAREASGKFEGQLRWRRPPQAKLNGIYSWATSRRRLSAIVTLQAQRRFHSQQRTSTCAGF